MKRYTYSIVDDDLAYTALLKKQLSNFPELEFIESYDRTIEAGVGIQRLNPDILFLDMKVDVLDGLDILRVLANPPRTILMSSSPDFTKEAIEFKVHHYIIKPASIDDLKMAVKKVTSA